MFSGGRTMMAQHLKQSRIPKCIFGCTMDSFFKRHKRRWWLLLPVLWLGESCHEQISREESHEATAPTRTTETALADTRFWNTHDSVETVPVSTCAGCHGDIVKRYARSAKAQALQATAHGPHDSLHSHAASPHYRDSLQRLNYRFYWKADTLRLEETHAGPRPPHRRTEPVAYAVGSRFNTQTHLVDFNGYVYQAPLSITRGGHAHLPAGFEGGHNSRFSRAVTAECISCHSDYPEVKKGSRNAYHRLATGISCRACHGPGAAHVRRMRRGDSVPTATQADLSIVNPAKLEAAYRDGMCRRCHLVGNAVLAEGKDWSDYRPGMKLEAVATVFLPRFNDPDDARYMATYFDRMQASACYQGSHRLAEMESMSCVSCHNPHAEAGANRRSRYNQVCADCHRPEADPPTVSCPLSQETRTARNGNDCVACHMPKSKSGSMDLPHVTAHDHRIGLPEDKRDSLVRDRQMAFDQLRAPHVARPEGPTLARAYLYYYEKFGRKPLLLDTALHYIAQLDSPARHRWMVYYHFLKEGNDREVLRHAEALPEAMLEAHPRLCYQVGQAHENLGQLAAATRYYQRAVRQMPLHLDYRLKLGGAWLARRDTARAGPIFRKLLRDQPRLPEAHNNLAFLALLRFELAKARRHLDQALQLRPDYPEAWLNMAKYYLGRQNLDQARQAVERALALNPDDPAARKLQAMIDAQQP